QGWVGPARVTEPCAFGEPTGEDAEPRADLEHDVCGTEVAHPLDHVEDVLVHEEVLAERLLRLNAHGKPNATAAFTCVAAASSSASSPRAPASAATVCPTLAGSFGRPRTGCGAR